MSDMATEQIERGVPIVDLPQEKQDRIPHLETQTDEVFKLRTQLAQFYIRNRDYLPSIQGEGKVGQTHHLRLTDIQSSVQEGKSLESLIDFHRADAVIDQRYLPENQKDILKKLRHLQITVVFKNALDIYSQLREKGGDWNDNDIARENNEVRDYYKMRWGEFGYVKRVFDQGTQRLKELEETEDLARSDPDFIIHADVIRSLEDQRREVQKDLRSLVEDNPEAYIYAFALQLNEAKKSFDEHGRIVETPYVKSKISYILREVETGRPVFIHGELGTGKSELAKHIARTRLSKPYLTRWERDNPSPLVLWEQENPKPKEAEKIKQWESHRKIVLQDWQARYNEEAEALVISGHRNIQQEQILAARSVKKTEAMPPEEQISIINQKWQQFREKSLEQTKAQDSDTEDLEQRLDAAKPIFEQAYLESFKAPLETTTILAPFLKAMQEGRPVIIDEMNGIPHYILIVLNDLLLSKVGEMVTPPFTEIPPFRIQEGFCVLATGNYKPEDGVMYVGRQPIDAAFLSRFALTSYDYLPMNKVFEPPELSPEGQREAREQNELFQMLVARFLNNNLSLSLPEGGLRQIEKLAVVARNLQDVFSGNEVNDAYFALVKGTSVKPQDVLKENVPSIRHLIPVLDQWRKDGFTKDLDYYLFLDYISRSNARPEEKIYIYNVFQTQGDFFPQTVIDDQNNTEWPSASDRDEVLKFPIEQKMFGTERYTGRRQGFGSSQHLKFYSVKDVVEELYGPAPQRKNLPKSFIEPGQHSVISAEDLNEKQLGRLRMSEDINQGLSDIFAAGYPDNFTPRSTPRGSNRWPWQK